MCALSIGNSSFPNLFEITKLQKDHIASAGVAIEKLFNNPDVETVELICEARQSYESKCTSYSRFILKYVAFLMYCGSYPSMTAWVHFSYLYFFRLASWWKTSQFPCEQSSRGNFGFPVCLKTSRKYYRSIGPHQMLPFSLGEDVQCCLLGVTIIYFM